MLEAGGLFLLMLCAGSVACKTGFLIPNLHLCYFSTKKFVIFNCIGSTSHRVIIVDQRGETKDRKLLSKESLTGGKSRKL